MNKKEIEYQNNKVENKKVEYQSNRHKEELKEKVPQNLINKILNIVSIDQLIKLYEIDDVKEYVSTVLRNKNGKKYQDAKSYQITLLMSSKINWSILSQYQKFLKNLLQNL